MNNSKRIYAIDNLRIILTSLVIIQHTAITYGVPISWYYHQMSNNIIQKGILGWIVSVNQAFFMGAFFFISGYLTPLSFARKGTRTYLIDRIIRLGIPVLVYSFTLNPFLWYITSNSNLTFIDFYHINFLHKAYFNPGPLWFAQFLLFLSLLFVITHFMRQMLKFILPIPSYKSWYATTLFPIILTASTVIIRFSSPIGKPLFFTTEAYIPQYILMFFWGVYIQKTHAIHLFILSVSKSTILWTLILMCVWPVLLYYGGALTGNLDVFRGGFHWQAIAYGIWESLLCISATTIFLRYCFQYRNKPSLFIERLARHSYLVYIIHSPVIVFLSLSLTSIAMAPILKSIIVMNIGIPLCYYTSIQIIKYIPSIQSVV